MSRWRRPSPLAQAGQTIVRTLDTNVVVRLLIGDDPQQTPIAERAFLEAIATGGVYLPDVVLAEVAWVLRGYDLDRQSRYALLERLVRTRGVVVDDIDAVIDALEQCQPGGRPGRSANPCPCRTHRCLAGVELRSALLQL